VATGKEEGKARLGILHLAREFLGGGE